MTFSEFLHRMFTEVPPRYDLINRVITFGLDQKWRREVSRECLASQPRRVLDLGCGTGDLMVILARQANGAALIGIDYSQPMLVRATGKARAVAGRNIAFVCGDAARLPFPDECFDCVVISFAFRNLTYRNPRALQHLAEVLRVLIRGGRYIIVETSQPKSRLVRKLYHLYLRWFVFRWGYWLSGNKPAYRYLAESAARFYAPEEVQEMLSAAGFGRVSFRRLFGGVAGIHVAIK